MSAFALATLPPVTRLLLVSDGSTTRSLQAIAGVDVELHVLEQRELDSNECMEERTHLRSTRRVMFRRSQLLAGKCVLSNNIVLYPPDNAEWNPISQLPLGLQLREKHAMQHREILSIGVDDETRQAFKEYLITTNAGSDQIYVKELFSPLIAPLADVTGGVDETVFTPNQ